MVVPTERDRLSVGSKGLYEKRRSIRRHAMAGFARPSNKLLLAGECLWCVSQAEPY